MEVFVLLDTYFSRDPEEPDLILQLVQESYSSNQDAEMRINQFGGFKIQKRQVDYIKLKPVFLKANVKGFYVNDKGIRKEFYDVLTIAYEGGGFWQFNRGLWYLLLGKRNVYTPKIQQAEPQTAPPSKSP
jgi:hypothetical protein